MIFAPEGKLPNHLPLIEIDYNVIDSEGLTRFRYKNVQSHVRLIIGQKNTASTHQGNISEEVQKDLDLLRTLEPPLPSSLKSYTYLPKSVERAQGSLYREIAKISDIPKREP